MIPAVKAMRISFHFSESFLMKNMGAAPSTVAIADMKLPIKADSTNEYSLQTETN